MKKILPFIIIAFCISCAASKATNTSSTNGYKFDFGGNSVSSYTSVNSGAVYNDATGYGFEPGSTPNSIKVSGSNALSDGYVTSNKPFFFSVKVPEGNYTVKINLGDKEGTSDAAIRVECRRMMVNRVKTKNGEIKNVEFAVHVRDSMIRNGSNLTRVRLKPRERNYLHWDNKLTFEFNGEAPKINTIEVMPATVTTMFLAGNSTVVDQDQEPWAAWGQMIPEFFEKGTVVVANYAESGESLSSFISERRFEKILSLIKAGDYAFVEFGHNDQKQKGAGVGAFTTYKKDLKFFIAEVKRKGATPVLVTSMQRRAFDSTGKIMHTLGDYPEAVRQAAKEENVAMIDLNAMSKLMYEAWGPVESKKAFVHYPANTFPGQKTELKDDTHFSPFGAYEIAKIILRGIRSNNLGLARYVKKGIPDFNPSKPDMPGSFYWPYSPSAAIIKPDGN